MTDLNVLNFSDYPSKATVLPAGQRLDPYWDGLWAHGSNARWLSARQARAQMDVGLINLPAPMRRSEDEGLATFTKMSPRNKELRALAAVDGWRTLSLEQLATMTGNPNLLSEQSTIINDGFCASLIDVGEFVPAAQRTSTSRRAMTVRPTASNVFDRKVQPTLSFAQSVRTTGGSPWKTGGQYDRHNMLCVELGLRAAEFCDVGTVLGEKHASASDLTRTTLPHAKAPESAGGKAADMVIVRRDGMRIAVELTASTSKFFEDKVSRWAEIISQTPWDSSGLMVVFVVAESAMAMRSGLANQVRSMVSRVTRAIPGSVSDSTAARMAVVSWEDWFPQKHAMSFDFLSMAAVRPTGMTPDVWQPCHLLDEDDVPFVPHIDHDATALVTNSRLLWSAPHFLEDQDQRPSLWPLPLAASGSMSIPVPPHSRPSRKVHGTPQFRSGRVGRVKPPAVLDGR